MARGEESIEFVVKVSFQTERNDLEKFEFNFHHRRMKTYFWKEAKELLLEYERGIHTGTILDVCLSRTVLINNMSPL